METWTRCPVCGQLGIYQIHPSVDDEVIIGSDDWLTVQSWKNCQKCGEEIYIVWQYKMQSQEMIPQKDIDQKGSN